MLRDTDIGEENSDNGVVIHILLNPAKIQTDVDIRKYTRSGLFVNLILYEKRKMAPKRDITLAKAMGKKLTELRRKKYPGHGGQLKCAEDFGVGSGAWSQWERGVRIPSDAYQRELAAFFGISITELRGEAVEQKSPADQAGENKGGATLQGYLAALSNLAGLAAVAADPDNSAWAEHATKVLVALHQGAPGVARAKGKSPRADIQGKNTA